MCGIYLQHKYKNQNPFLLFTKNRRDILKDILKDPVNNLSIYFLLDFSVDTFLKIILSFICVIYLELAEISDLFVT